MNVLYNGRLGSYYSKVKHNAKPMALLHFLVIIHVACKTHYILLACVLFPALRTTLIVAILQSLDGKDSG